MVLEVLITGAIKRSLEFKLAILCLAFVGLELLSRNDLLEHTLQALKSEHMKLAMRQEPGPLGSSSMRKASQAASHGRWERCRSFETLKTALAPGRHIWKEGHGPIIL